MKLLVLAGYTRSLTVFRGDLLRAMIANGYEVHACAPEPDEGAALAKMNVQFHQLPMVRGGTNPFADFRLIKQYEALIRSVMPDILFCYTIKPNIYGTYAAWRVGIKNINLMVTGLGNVFIDNGGLKRKLLRNVVNIMYKRATKLARTVIFQNPDDKAYMVDNGLVDPAKTHLVNGSGVNMDYFRPTSLPHTPVFLMVSRLLREKGVMEYLNAARFVKKKHSSARMLLVGPYEHNDFALQEKDIRPYIEDGSIEYVGETADVRPYYEMASVVVLPSYREGTPRTILEAMACGRAAITTDAPGCRETVIHETTGLLTPVGDAQALAQAMLWMAERPETVRQMGEAGRTYCTQRYEISKVNAQMLHIMGLSNNPLQAEVRMRG